jgi:DNA-binding SARP family transcriptional activator
MEFRLLGALEVAEAEALLSVGTIKHKALLAILLLHANEVVTTDALVDELWGGSPPPSATATLRGYVSGIRRALEPGVKAGHHSVLETRPSGYLLAVPPEQIDVSRFETLLRKGREELRRQRWAQASASFEQALALWRGPALSDFAYHPFAQAETTRLAEARLSAEEGRMTAELALGNHHEVVGELGNLAASTPFREHLWGLLIVALYRCGRQGEALRTYQRLRGALAEELGIEPSPELRDLEHSILGQDAELSWQPPHGQPGEAGGIGAGGSRPSTVALPLPEALGTDERTAFVGRHAEEEILAMMWSQAVAGHRQLAVLSGEAGIGKSRLAKEVARNLHIEGAIVLYGRCDEELVVPHQPFIEALTHYVAECGADDLRSHLGATGQELSRLLPDVGRRLPGLPEPARAEPETQRYRLFDAVTELLARIAGSAALLLVLDDLHWADKPTLLLLRHLLLRGPDDVPLLVLGIRRDEEPGATDGLTEVLADVSRRHRVERIALRGLSDDDIAGVLEVTGESRPDDEMLAVARAIRRETDGNPLFVEEIVHHLRETGALDQAPGAGSDTSGIISAIGIPDGVRQVVTRRLSRLAPATRQALAVASVIGPDFELDVMERAGGLEPDALLDALDQASSARLVVEVAEGGERYGFCHEVVRDSIYSGLTGARRAQLHRRVAGALEELAAGDPDARLAPRAHHLWKAGAAADAAKAVDCARRAAGHALAQVAYEQAALNYRQALEALQRQPRGDPALRCELLLCLGEAHNKAGELLEGKEVFLEAAEAARRLEAPEQLGKAALGYGGPVPVAAYVEDPVSVALVQEALRALGQHDSACRALLLTRLAQWSYRSSPFSERVSLCDQALEMARRLDDPRVLACVLHDRHWALFGRENLEDRVAVGREIRELGRRLGDDELVLQGDQCLVHAYLEWGDVPAFKRAVEGRDRLAQELRQPQYLWNVIVSKALDAILQGRFAEAAVMVERALATRYRADPRQASYVYLAQQFMLYWLQGRLDEQAAALTQLVQKYPSAAVRRAVAGWFLAETGRSAAARAELDVLSPSELAAAPTDLDFYATVAGATMTSVRLGDARLAPTLFEMLLPFASRNCIVGQSSFLGAASYYLGLLTRLTGQPAAAAVHLEAALARHLEMDAHPFVALTQYALAGTLHDLGGRPRRERADGLLRQSTATAARLGMAGLLKDASALRDRGAARLADA